jgi:hypothetical protein
LTQGNRSVRPQRWRKIPECGFVRRAAGPPTGTAAKRGVRPLSDHRQSSRLGQSSSRPVEAAGPGTPRTGTATLKRGVQSAEGNFKESTGGLIRQHTQCTAVEGGRWKVGRERVSVDGTQAQKRKPKRRCLHSPRLPASATEFVTCRMADAPKETARLTVHSPGASPTYTIQYETANGSPSKRGLPAARSCG